MYWYVFGYISFCSSKTNWWNRCWSKKCVKEIYGKSWSEIATPNNFGKLFKDAVNTKDLNGIKSPGIRSTGRCDEYERLTYS